jgi:CHAD domain-containing protein
MANSFKTYRALISSLRKTVPPAYPISVRRRKLNKKLEGRCWKHGKKFIIEIANNLDEARAIDVLLHEWAHARAWNHMLDTASTDELFNKLAHDAAWGVAYSEVYAASERNFTAGVL